VGDIIRVTGAGAGGWQILSNAGQSIITDGLTFVGMDWTQTSATAASWQAVASSSDGSHLVAVVYNGGIYTSAPYTATGTAGSITGSRYDTIELQYIGGGSFNILSSKGYDLYTEQPIWYLNNRGIHRRQEGFLLGRSRAKIYLHGCSRSGKEMDQARQGPAHYIFLAGHPL
jgi:hypothetical protein